MKPTVVLANHFTVCANGRTLIIEVDGLPLLIDVDRAWALVRAEGKRR